MEYIPLSGNAARQLIDACVVFDEHQRVRAQARAYAGGMYWKRQDAYEYLVKTAPNNRQKRLGPRSAQLEAVYAEFTGRKQALEQRLAALRLQLTDAERTNKALKAGRVPPTVVAVLASIEEAGLDAHFVVVGTHALYAYEAAAGVRIVQGALATQDVDLLWDARRRVQFVTDMEKFDGSMLRVLQSADASFQRKEGHKEGHKETAINAKGFEVDFLRRPTSALFLTPN